MAAVAVATAALFYVTPVLNTYFNFFTSLVT